MNDSKIPHGAGRVAQIVEDLPRKPEDLSSNSSTAKMKKKVSHVFPKQLA
jgi:hypothetical protein